jgi:kynurenine aminotransferase
MKKVQIPTNYIFPAHIENKPRDFKLTWWLIKELGIAAIPPSEFYTEAHQAVAENYLRYYVSFLILLT